MTVGTSTTPVDEPASPLRRLAVRAVRHFRTQVEDWYDECRALTDWEDQNLVDDKTPARLAEHARSGTSRDALLKALQSRYAEFRRARRKPTTIPPSA